MAEPIKFTELSNVGNLSASAIMAVVQQQGGELVSLQCSAAQMAELISNDIEYQNLTTEGKTLVEAINEAAQTGGGGDVTKAYVDAENAKQDEETATIKADLTELDTILDLQDVGGVEVLTPYETVQGYYLGATYKSNSGYRTKKYNGIVGGATYYASTYTNEATGTGLIHWFDADGTHISYDNKGIGSWVDVEVVAPINAVSCAISGRVKSDYDATTTIQLKNITTAGKTSKRLDNIDDIKSFKKLAFNIAENGDLIVASKYNSENDFLVTISKKGASSLPQIYKMYKIPNTSAEISNDFSNLPTAFCSPTSDWLSPYGNLYVKNNRDTDITTQFYWCGGWHGTSGNSGYATAKNIKYEVFADGIEVNELGTFYADEVKVIIVNGIMAINTVKTDGTGRTPLTETTIITFKPNSYIEIDTQIEVNEDVQIGHYYGLQCEFLSVWNGGQLNVDDIVNKGWFDNASTSTQGSTKSESICNNFIVRNSNKTDFVECYVTPNFGLSNRRLISDTDKTVWTANYNKSYFNLIGSNDLMEGDVLTFRGGYHFYSM